MKGNMQRRNFLGGLAGIFAAGSAPAIVHGSMKIWVPKKQEVSQAAAVYQPYLPDPVSWKHYADQLSGRQDALGEAFYPTVVVAANSVLGKINTLRLIREIERNMNKTLIGLR